MSFYLVAPQPVSRIQIGEEKVVFAGVVEDKQKQQVVMTVNTKRELCLFEYKSGLKKSASILVNDGKVIDYVVKIDEFQDILAIQTRKKVYLLKKSNIFMDIKEGIELKQLTLFKKINKNGEKLIDYSSLMNKEVNIYKEKGEYYVKLAGKSKDRVTFYYGQLNKEKQSGIILLESPTQTSSLFNFSISAHLPSITLYQVYTNKSKPIKVHHFSYILHPQQQPSQIDSQFSINHFNKHLTIVSFYQLNQSLFGLIGSDVVEGQTQSKFTRNYLSFKNVLMEKCFIFQKGCYQWCQKKGTISIDALVYWKQSTFCYQLTPQSYDTSFDANIKGKVQHSSSNYLISTKDNSLLIHKKHKKASLYLKLLNSILPKNKDFHSQILSFLR